MRLDTKLDTLLKGQKDLETRIENFEKKFNDNDSSSNTKNIDPEFVKVRKQLYINYCMSISVN